MAIQGVARFEGIWKRFRRGEIHDSLRDLLPSVAARLAGRLPSTTSLNSNEFWALKDVSFQVDPGSALGIIGANGAGKSTVLKILTKILRPTSGISEIRGRIGALIEVSAGFHQDLTGRENVYLQGSIMGMSMAMIRTKFDDIVEFSGVSEFLDTPVKRYSSGMQARLGFSIAAHLDPDVLIIDEVLAVGDFRFQDRAFGRIREMVTSGIPVVIVSHQLDRIASLCTEAMVLERGAVAHRGSPADCIAWYLSGSRASLAESGTQSGIELHEVGSAAQLEVASGGRIAFRLVGEITAPEIARGEDVSVRVRSAASGQVVFGTSLARCGMDLPPTGGFEIELDLEMNLKPGVYTIEPHVVDRQTGHDTGAGPIAYAQVSNDPGFIGSAQLKPLVRFLGTNGSQPS
jgi:ABC-type polysaccharide/polyol phosphate transport system ATPase subunit